MIAIQDNYSQDPIEDQSIPSFEQLLPAIQRQAQVAFQNYELDQQEELVAEVIANALGDYRSLIQRGKGELIYSTPLTTFSIWQVREGRRVGTPMNINDVSSEYSQRKRNIRVRSLDQYHSVRHEWQEVVVEDRTSTPAEIATTRIDFSCWLKTLKPKLRKLALFLASGESNMNAAKKFKVSMGRISQYRRELKNSWMLFQS